MVSSLATHAAPSKITRWLALVELAKPESGIRADGTPQEAIALADRPEWFCPVTLVIARANAYPGC
jgi:hypothetical protein